MQIACTTAPGRGDTDLLLQDLAAWAHAGERDQEGEIHYRPRATAVPHPAAERTEDRAGQRVEAGEDVCRRQFHAIGAAVVVRQIARQGYEAAEDEEVVCGEAPDLDVLERRELFGNAHASRAGPRPLGIDRVGPCQQGEAGGGQRDHDRVNARRSFPARGDDERRRGEVRVRGPPRLPAPTIPSAVP